MDEKLILSKDKTNRDFAVILISAVFLFVVISIVPMISGAIYGNITFSNFTLAKVNITNATAGTLWVTCKANFTSIRNVTVWYNTTSSGTLAARGEKLGKIAKTVANASANQKIFNIPIIINSTYVGSTVSADHAGYGFWCAPRNGTTGALVWRQNSTATKNGTIDRTAPTLNLKGYTNATPKKNTAQLTLNITISDIVAGILDGTRCKLNTNGTGTNQSIGVTKKNHTFGWCSSSAFNLTGQGDGNKLLFVYMNDSANARKLLSNATTYVRVDTTAPSAVASCNPATVIKGSTIVCGCTASDPTSGVDTQTADSTIVTSSAGAFDYTCSVTDLAGNTASHTTTYNVDTSGGSGGSSSSSSGGSAVASSVRQNTFPTISTGSASVMKNFDEATGVKEIRIEVNNNAQNVKITVSKYDGKPAEVTKEKTGKVYQYMQINTENLAENLKKATVTFKAKKSWASENSVEKEKVVVSKFDEEVGEWNELATTYKEEDDTYYYYEVELTSFSYFAIGEKAPVVEEKEKGITTILGDVGTKAKDKASWIIAVIILLALVAVGFAVKRMKN